MTDQQPKLGPQPLELNRDAATRPAMAERPRRNIGDAIQAGLGFLDARWNGHWEQSSLLPRAAEVRCTACILSRLAEIPAQYKSQSLERKTESSLDWLRQKLGPQGSWGPGPEGDAISNAWAILALRGYRRAIPATALDFLRRCRRFVGGFATSSVAQDGAQLVSCPEATAVSVRALGDLDWGAEDYLAAWLRSAASATSGGRASQFYVCSEVLDWGEGKASPSLLSVVQQVAAGFGNDGAFDRALLLRCLLRLRMQRAWAVAAGLRAMQIEDGAWGEQDDRKTLATVTAVSALVLAESQPGLYFGSDLPLPRRLQQP